MDQTIATNAIKFLERVDLKGREVPAFMQVQQVLLAYANPPAPLKEEKKEEESPSDSSNERLLPRWKEADQS